MLTETWLADRLLILIPLVMALSVHEWAHAWTAWRLGDPTGTQEGRLSLNPLHHLDPIGTLLLPLLGVPFGWARPVPFNEAYFRGRFAQRWGRFLTAIAGPVSNVLMALLVLVLFQLGDTLRWPGTMLGVSLDSALHSLLLNLFFINCLLAVFNMLPIPPLDGSHIIDSVLPRRYRPLWEAFSLKAPYVLAAVIILPFLIGINIFQPIIRVVLELAPL